MSEPRKNHLSIDGGQVKEDEHVSSYRPIPESDTVPDFRTSKSSLAKSKEKLSADGAEEKLLAKEEEAKITTRVDMADAKYVVGDHRNGDAKIELDANKRQFTGLTKEELMKYADDPFWVRLRWFMFILFWALWLCMLVGAIVIIVQAPKCAPPPPRTWYENGPLVEMSLEQDYSEMEEHLPFLQKANVAGIFINSPQDTYKVLDDQPYIEKFKKFVDNAQKYSIKVIVDLTANFVPKSHNWFQLSTNKSSEFSNYFIWKTSTEFEETENNGTTKRKAPNNWVSTLDEPAWTFNENRGEFYLHQFGEDQPDLNMNNPDVVKQFDSALKRWMGIGVAGVRLHNARELLVDISFAPEKESGAPGVVHSQYAYWKHEHTSDQPGLDSLLQHWSYIVDNSSSTPGKGETVFTLAERAGRPEFVSSALRPRSAAPLPVRSAVDAARRMRSLFGVTWPALQLISDDVGDQELASFAMLLPAAPVLNIQQLESDNSTDTAEESFATLVKLREDATLQHGEHSVDAVPTLASAEKLLACARWKSGHMGYLALYNPLADEARGNLTALAAAGLHALPADYTVYHVSAAIKNLTSYTKNHVVHGDDVLVPAKATVILSFVPNKPEED